MFQADTRFDQQDMVYTSLLQQVFSRLKRVIFIYRGRYRRMFLGERRGVPSILKSEMYRSRPMMAPIVRFNRLTNDPRPIEDNLNDVYFNSCDPQTPIHRWLSLLKEWGVSYGHNVDYRFMVAYGGRSVDGRGDGDYFGFTYGCEWRRPKITARGDAVE